MRNLNFKTKESYLTYRSDWKAEYNELSQDIRNLKWLRATRCRAYPKVTKDLKRPDEEYYWKLVAGVKKYLGDIPQYGKLVKKYFGDDPYWIEGKLQYKRIESTCMLAELKQAKIDSNEMRQKSLVVNCL
jgi:hypothetical protein